MVTSPFNADVLAGSNRRPLTLVNGRTFLVAAADGGVRFADNGVVFEDLRLLSHLTFEIAGAVGVIQREPLGISTPTPFQAAAVSRPDPTLVESTLTEFYIHRQWIGRGVRHDIEIHNTGTDAIDRSVIVHADTDFAHLFDMKAGRSGTAVSELRWDGDRGRLVDPSDSSRAVDIRASAAATRDQRDKALRWDLTCLPGETATVRLSFEPVWDGDRAGLAFPIDAPPAMSRPTRSLERWREVAPAVHSDDSRLSTAMTASLADIASLRIFDPDHADRVVVAAGAPWFMTLFGRDSLLTSWMVLPFLPELTVGTLDALAELQGTQDRPQNEEQPGKIIHELRRHGGDAAFADRGRYYGTVDATPLFVMVAAEAHRWGHLRGDALTRRWPAIRAAVDWIRRRIDHDPGGFLRYRRSTDIGLVNQGWKDSWDGVNFADGRLPTGGIALAEVQGYAYAALRDAADLLVDVDDDLDAAELRAEADRLAERFDRHFWDESSSSYGVGLDGDDRLIDSVTTNPGHALWCGIGAPEKATRYLDRAMVDLFSGWGLRTLSPTARRYDPLSYHNGSVWPHDTALVAAGASRVGRFDVVDLLADAALDASAHFAGRPPELFAGVDRSVIEIPVAYPSSCSPQAWASASTLLMLRSRLDLQPGAPDELPRIGRLPPLDVTSVIGIRHGSARLRADVDHGRWNITS